MSLSSNATARVVSSDLHVNRPAASSPPPPPAHGPAKPRASSYSSSALHTTTDAAAGLSIGAAAAAVDRFSPAAAQISSSSSSSISAVPSADPQSPPSPTKITTTAIATQAPATSTGTNRKRSLSPSSQEESHHHHRPSSASQPPMSSAASRPRRIVTTYRSKRLSRTEEVDENESRRPQAPRSRVVLPSTLSLDDQVALARSASNHSLEPSNYVASQEQSAATRTRSLKRASSPLPVADGGAAQTPKARKVAGALKRAHTWDSPSSGGSASLGSLALHPNVESEPESEPPEQASPTPRQPKSCDDPLSFFNLDPPSSTSLSTETATTTSPPRARRVSRMKAGAPRQPASQGPPPVRRVQSVDSGLPATGAGPLLNIINGSSMPPSSDLMTSSSCGASPNSFVGESDDPAPSGPSSPVKATATSSAVSGRQPVAAQTYSRVRSYLLSDAEDEPKSARQRDAQKDEGLSSDEDEERRDFKSIHELRAVGETARFADKMEYIFGGLELSESVNIRRASYIDLATAVTEPSFVNRSRAYGFDAKLFRAVEAEEDPFSLAIASIIILVWLSQDKKNVELCLSEVKFVGKILSCTTTAADCLIAPARSKYENRLVGDIKTILAAASSAIPFEIYPISMFSLNFASLLLLFRNPQSAPVFSSILSDPVNSQFGLKIVNLLVDLPTVAGTSERIGLAEAALEFLNVARSRPALHLQLFGAGNCIQSLSCALSKAEDANHPAVVPILKSFVDMTAEAPGACDALTFINEDVSQPATAPGLQSIIGMMNIAFADVAKSGDASLTLSVDAVVLGLACVSNVLRQGGRHLEAFSKLAVNGRHPITLIAEVFRMFADLPPDDGKAVSVYAAVLLGFAVSGHSENAEVLKHALGPSSFSGIAELLTEFADAHPSQSQEEPSERLSGAVGENSEGETEQLQLRIRKIAEELRILART